MENKKTFEECYEEILDLMKKKRSKWILNDFAHMDYEDVVQKVLMQIFEKWHLYDQSKHLRPWLNKVIDNRMQNIYRDEYGVYAKPCVGCANNQGDDLCSYTPSQKQCCECIQYKSWYIEKKRGFEIKVPQEYDENHHESVHDNGIHNCDIEKIHAQVLDFLEGTDKKLYQLIFIDNKSSQEIAKDMNYKQNSESSASYIKKHEVRLRKFVVQLHKDGKIDLL